MAGTEEQISELKKKLDKANTARVVLLRRLDALRREMAGTAGLIRDYGELLRHIE